MGTKQLLLLGAVLLLLLPLARANHDIVAQGGNITLLKIFSTRQTDHWQGFAGKVFFGTNATAPSILNATGGFVNGTDLFFQIACDNPTSATGFILVSNSSTPPVGLVPGNLSILDALTGGKSDSGSRTFTGNTSFAFSTGTVSGVPTTFTFVNESPQSSSFREGYFNQGNNIVFATVIEVDLTGYNTSFFDYQILALAQNRTTVPYFLFGDITFTCPGAPGTGGGGGGGYWPIIIIRKPFPRPTFPPRLEQVEEILGNLTLIIDPAASLVLTEQDVHGRLINNNPWEIGEVSIDALLPQMLVGPAEAHPRPMLFWQSALPGIKDHGPRGAHVYNWAVSGLPYFPSILPYSVNEFTFQVMPPLMLPKQVDLVGHAYSGKARIASDIAPYDVLVPEFAVYPYRASERVLALYHVVDNRGKPGKSINIEFALNQRKSTLVAEMLGPLYLPEDSVAIFSHEYALSARAQQAEEVRTRLYAPDITAAASAALR